MLLLPKVEPAIVAGLGFGAATGLAIASSTVDELPVLCLFRRCTGGYCPGCGGSRAAVALLRGDIAESWAHHPWILLLLAQTAALVGALAIGRPVFTPRVRHRLLIGNLALGLGIWAFRLALSTIPVPFA